MRLEDRIAKTDWAAASTALDERGMAKLPGLLTPEECAGLMPLFEEREMFRSRIDMARYSYGEGVYQYFTNPLPEIVARLRSALYPPLGLIANDWAERFGETPGWPEDHVELLDRCRATGQTKPTPLMLKYRSGDYNCLHQDLYGEVHFPLQAVIMLSDPEKDFSGGEFVLVENRPRLQSRAYVARLGQGDCAIFPVREKPRATKRGWSKSQLRHGVSIVEDGERMTLGIIFHDAA